MELMLDWIHDGALWIVIGLILLFAGWVTYNLFRDNSTTSTLLCIFWLPDFWNAVGHIIGALLKAIFNSRD